MTCHISPNLSHMYVLSFVSVHEIPEVDHSNESHSAVLSCVTAFCDVVLNVWMEPTSVFIQMKATVVYCGCMNGP